ncbi:hypothetical protein ACLOJK_040313 [Asimina triloba]
MAFSSSSCVGLIALTVVAALLQCIAADTYNVGDTDGWFISPQGAQFYTNWVSSPSRSMMFSVSIIALFLSLKFSSSSLSSSSSLGLAWNYESISKPFNFIAGDHDVVEVNKAEFDACTASNPIGDVKRSSPASITLDRAGSHYFICTFPQHCAAGQKLAVDVVAAGHNNTPTTPTPMPATSAAGCGPELAPTSGGDSPTPPNAAPSLITGWEGVTGVVAAVFSAFFL